MVASDAEHVSMLDGLRMRSVLLMTITVHEAKGAVDFAKALWEGRVEP